MVLLLFFNYCIVFIIVVIHSFAYPADFDVIPPPLAIVSISVSCSLGSGGLTGPHGYAPIFVRKNGGPSRVPGSAMP
jgi:hypothetical protein